MPEHPGHPKALAVAAQAGRVEVNGDGSAVRDFVHVDDVPSAFLLAVENGCQPAAGGPGEDLSRGAQHDHEEKRPMRALFFRDHEISGSGAARTR